MAPAPSPALSPHSLGSNLTCLCLFGGLTKLCPALEALQVLFPLLRARSCQPYFNRPTLSPRSGPPPLGSRHNRPALPQPPVRILSRALRPRTQITQTGAPFLMSLLPVVTVSLCATPSPSTWPGPGQVHMEILADESRWRPARWGQVGCLGQLGPFHH